MRPLETISLLLIGASIYLLIFKKDERKFLASLFFSILCVILQYYIEGFRWQLNFALFIMPFIYLRFKLFDNRSVVLNTITITWFFLAVFIPYIIPVFDLPKPDGEYDIGTELFCWTDSTRSEWFTKEDSTDFRKLVIQSWYPGKKKNLSQRNSYMNYMDLRAKTMAKAGKIPSFLPKHLEYVKSNSFKNIPVRNSDQKLPVIIFSHGITGSRLLHQALFESLASQGYVIFAINHSYDANITIYPDSSIADYRSDLTGHPDSLLIRKKQIITRTNDITFLINQLEKIESKKTTSLLYNQLDLTKIAIAGHSYGGATAIFASSLDNRIKSCFVLDGWFSPLPDKIVTSGLDIPLFCIGRPSWDDSDYPSNYKNLELLLNASTSQKFHVFIKNSLHLDFTDIPLFSPVIKYVMDVGKNSPEKSIKIINDLAFLFFEKTLYEKKNIDLNNYLKDNVFIQN
jgi:pimeloyl-ACP methyl ester carboxylesterase